MLRRRRAHPRVHNPARRFDQKHFLLRERVAEIRPRRSGFPQPRNAVNSFSRRSGRGPQPGSHLSFRRGRRRGGGDGSGRLRSTSHQLKLPAHKILGPEKRRLFCPPMLSSQARATPVVTLQGQGLLPPIQDNRRTPQELP